MAQLPPVHFDHISVKDSESGTLHHKFKFILHAVEIASKPVCSLSEERENQMGSHHIEVEEKYLSLRSKLTPLIQPLPNSYI